VRAAIDAMAQISDSSFFEALLEAVLAQYSADISDAARGAMYNLEGDIVQLAARSIGNRSPDGKLSALAFLLDEDELTSEQKSAIAAAAIRDALATETSRRSTEDTLREVRFLASDFISEQGYSEATDAMIAHFNQTFLEFDRGQVTRSRVLDAILGLGNMGTEAAAERLSRFLELLNGYTENDRPYDTRIVMATIGNLEELGYPVAYNPLFYASILEAYPAQVQNAAEEAMAAIQQ
jgi:triphosphoribosyl-dephospho-CoA synthetase